MIDKERSGHGGRRPGAGAPKGNLNAFKHGFCSKQYDLRLQQTARLRQHELLAHMRDLVRAYHLAGLSRRRRANLVQQGGLIVLASWHGLCQALLEEQSRG